MDAFQSSPGLSLIVRDANSSRKESKVPLHRSIQSVFPRSRVFPSRYISHPEILENVIGFYPDRPSPSLRPTIRLNSTATEERKSKASKLCFSSLIGKNCLIWILMYSQNQSLKFQINFLSSFRNI